MSTQRDDAIDLLKKHWPKEGGRHNAFQALIGGLIRAKYKETEDLVEQLIEATGDEESEKRLALINETRSRLANKDKVSGWPTLGRLLGGDGVVLKVRNLLGLYIRLKDLAAAKQLPEEFLRELGLRDFDNGVIIPYRDRRGKTVAEKERTRLSAREGSKWPHKKKPQAYGDERLAEADKAGKPLILVEGESDCWSLWFHGYSALGLPGSNTVAKTLHDYHVKNRETLYVVQESDKGGELFVEGVRKRLGALDREGVLRVVCFDGANDANALHCLDPEQFKNRFDAAMESADAIEVIPGDETLPVGGGDGDKKPSMATRLVSLVESNKVELFHNPDGDPFATFETGGHYETWPLKVRGFKRWLKRLYYGAEKKAPNSNAMSDALGVLEGKACYEGEEHQVHLRVASCDGKFYLDLCDAAWEVLEFDAEGWRLAENPPVRFRRSPGMLPLPHPEPGTSLEDLRELVNVASDEDWLLLVGWLAATLRPTGPYPLLVLTGEQGTAKSTLGRILRLLVDPARAMLRSDPSDTRDLMIAANNGWVVSYDNLSWIPSWLSDALCRLATGGGFGTRQLYTDDEEMIFDSVRPAMLTSIEDVVTASDLLDRSIFLRLEPIPDEKRRTEEELNAEIDRLRPGILGALLTAVSDGLRLLPDIKLDRLPRMADFAKWAEAVCRGLGVEEEGFLDAYNANRKDVNALALEVSPIVPVLMRALEALEDQEITDTPTNIFEWLTGEATDEEKKLKGWPKKTNKCSGLLRRSAPNLRRLGYEINLNKKGPRPKQERLMYFKAPPEGESEDNLSSPSSPSSPQEPKPFEDNDLRGDDKNKSDRPRTVPDRPQDARPSDGDDTGTVRGRYASNLSSPRKPLKTKGVKPDGDDGDDGDDKILSLSCSGSDEVPFAVVDNDAGLATVLQALDTTEVVGLDTETTGLDPRKDRVRLLQLALDTTDGPPQVFIIDTFRVNPSPLWDAFEDKRIVAHNLMFDASMLWWGFGFRPTSEMSFSCTQTMARLLHAGERLGKFGDCDLKALCKRYLDIELDKAEQKNSWEGDLTPEQYRYAALDVAVLRPLREKLTLAIHEAKLTEVASLESRVLPAMIHLANNGVLIDEEHRQSLARELDADTRAALDRLDAVAPPQDGDIEGMSSRKWGSPPVVLNALKTAGYKVDDLNDVKEETLARLDGELPLKIREYRGYRDKSSKYGSRSKFKNFIHDDGRVYASWDQLGNVAGRAKCKSPNLQGVLRDPRIRRMFVAGEGHVLIKADFATAHLRIVAKLVGERVMLDAFAKGEDLHRITAQSLLGREDIGKEDRRLAKAVAFGFLYGMREATFREYAKKSYGLDLSLQQAAEYREKFFRTYPGLERWHDKTYENRNRQRETRTSLGRRRIIDSKTPLQERLNNPVLGAEADAAKEALALLWDRREECPEAKVVLWVHDEFVVEVPQEQAEGAAKWLQRAMEDGMRPFVEPIPPTVETHIGKTWGGD